MDEGSSGGSAPATTSADESGSVTSAADDTGDPTASDDGASEDSGPPPCNAMGFVDDAVAWSLPASPASVMYEPFPRVGGDAQCSGTGYSDFDYALADLTGDGAPDLVVTNACDPGEGIGVDHWLVYAGGDDGFSGDAIAWTLPTSPASVMYEPFPRMGGDAQCSATGYSDFVYALADLTGDGAPDLVVTNACDPGEGIGVDHWLVYAGNGEGFTDDAIAWTLPTSPASVMYEPFPRMGGDAQCSGTGYSDFVYALADLTGDGASDLVVTNACDPGEGIGVDHWLVYPGGSDGFADDAIAWTLPTSPVSVMYEPFPRMGGDAQCSGTGYSDFAYALADLTGDGSSDLVITNACDPGEGIGVENWLVYAGGSDGFASVPFAWPLPMSPASVMYEPFPRMGGDAQCSGTGYSDFDYALVDLGGDGAADLVVTNACDPGEGIGVEHWLVYAGGSDGFATDAIAWPLPASPASVMYEPFPRMGGDAQCSGTGYSDFVYALSDLGGDGAPDLVVTNACDPGEGIGVEHWLVYPASCRG
jgi:hypothetical protein